jgi:hypothetical protein
MVSIFLLTHKGKLEHSASTASDFLRIDTIGETRTYICPLTDTFDYWLQASQSDVSDSGLCRLITLQALKAIAQIQ